MEYVVLPNASEINPIIISSILACWTIPVPGAMLGYQFQVTSRSHHLTLKPLNLLDFLSNYGHINVTFTINNPITDKLLQAS